MHKLLIALSLMVLFSFGCQKNDSNTSGVSADHQEEQTKANTSKERTEIPTDTTPRDQPL